MNIRKALVLVLILSILGKFLGFIRDILITSFLGFGYETDALLLSLSVITILFSVFNATIRTSFSPLFSSRYFKEKLTVLKQYNNIRNILILLSVIISFLIALFSEQVIYIFAPGLDDTSSEFAAKCLRILSVLLVFYNIYYLTTGFLQSIKIYSTVETANVFNNLFIILSIIVLFNSLGIYAILFGYILGSLIQVLYSRFIFNKKVSYRLNYKINLKDETWKKFVNNSKFILLGTLVAQVTAFSDKFVASFLSEGSISALHYADLLKNLPLTMVILAITNVLFTNLSISYKESTSIEFKKNVYTQLRYLIFLITPFALMLIVFSEEIVKIVFYRGEFSLLGVEMTASALQAYSLGMYFWVIKEVFTKVSYAAMDTKNPFIISLISLTINITFNFIFGYYFGHVGIALATTLAISINSLIIILLLHRKKILSFTVKDLIYFIKVILMFIFMLVTTTFVNNLFINTDNEILVLCLGSLFVIIIWLLSSGVIGVKKRELLKMMLKRS